jgi:proteasome alpha subunit
MGLATAFAQTLGAIFTREPKPFEVEVLIAEISEDGDEHRLFRVTYDGTLYDERQFVAIGGKAEQLTEALEEKWEPGMTLAKALEVASEVFRQAEGREIEGWEAGVLDSSNGRRAFRRLGADELPSR